MGVLKEYRCLAHGPFEGEEPVCPKAGCTTVERAFFTPVGIRSPRTSSLDQSLNRIAAEHGLTDMNNHGGTTAARVHPVLQGQARAQAEEYQSLLARRFGAKSFTQTNAGLGAWGSVAPGGVYRSGGEIVEAQRGQGAAASMAAIGAPPTNAVAEAREALVKPRVERIFSADDRKVA